MGSEDQQSVQNLLDAFRSGDDQAGARLMEHLYPELRRMAAIQMKGEKPWHSWQPTLLVNELYLKLIKVDALKPSEANQQNDRAAFFGLAGQIMRRLLMQHARPLAFRAEKVMLFEEAKLQAESGTMEVEHMLAGLAAVKPELRAVVEMKVFEGLTAEEIAGRLGCATVTVNRYWRFARHWLRTSLGADPTWQNKTPI